MKTVDGTLCFCGNNFPSTSVVPAAQCGVPCPVAPAESCGGPCTLDVFEFDCGGHPRTDTSPSTEDYYRAMFKRIEVGAKSSIWGWCQKLDLGGGHVTFAFTYGASSAFIVEDGNTSYHHSRL